MYYIIQFGIMGGHYKRPIDDDVFQPFIREVNDRVYAVLDQQRSRYIDSVSRSMLTLTDSPSELKLGQYALHMIMSGQSMLVHLSTEPELTPEEITAFKNDIPDNWVVRVYRELEQ